MKTALTSFDLRALVTEWQDVLGGFVDKVYQRGDELILRLNVPGRGRRELYSKAGRWLCLHEIEDKPEAPPPFAQTLRRLLDNARVIAIEQRGLDRIAVFTLERGPETYRLVFEVFGKGNVVLVKGPTTVACLTTQAFKDRKVKVGEPYSYPNVGTNPLELDRAGFAEALHGSKGQVVRVLATALNLGGQYAEELCRRADVPKDTKVKDLTGGQADAFYTALNNIVVAVDEERRPAVLLAGGQAVDAVPIDLVVFAGSERQPFPTFNEALSHYITVARPEEEAVDEIAAKFERRIAQQEESLRSLREEIGHLEARAHFLYAHYEPFDELLKAIREGREPPANAQVKSIDRKTRTVTLGIADFDAITLAYEKDVTANAQDFYERRREAQLKADRVEEALDATRREMSEARRKAVRIVSKPRVRATARLWFDAYRWTFSSEGLLILGGRDARSNDQLVKKHLKEGDRYAHADVHGAPSTVVKDGSRATDATLREACTFALAYSKAWSSGLASGSAYWVLPEQVSKQAESGEYLPRGAFVIRGKRNYIHDLAVTLGVGEVEVEGHRKIMGGPVSAVSARSTRYVSLVPGQGDRERLARRLAEVFEVPIEDVGRVLPAGGIRVAAAHGLEIEGSPRSSS